MYLTIYFISALVMRDLNPPTAWVQYTKSFASFSACTERLAEDHILIAESLRKAITDSSMEILDWKCLTFNEAYQMNLDLGHKR